MSRHLIWLSAILLVAGLGLAACDEAPAAETPIPTNTPIPTSTPLPPGFDPVTRNDDWEPVIQDFDGVQMALVPAGCFRVGDGERVCFDAPFWMDVYEVTNAQFGSAAPECTQWSSGDDQPRICVNWYDAAAHCESRGARLPTEAEWEYAARGPDQLLFPWGNGYAWENCVCYCYRYPPPHGPANVGSIPAGVTWVGAQDMVGNVWEWTTTHYDGETYVVRGGSWGAFRYILSMDRRRATPDFSISHFGGFRCVRPYGE